MSGIFGFLINNQNNEQRQDISVMLPWNRLYGNDAEDTITGNGIALGCCVENLSEKHPQNKPIIQNGDQYGVIDAIIYNRDELLEGRSEDEQMISDVELLLKYINKHGLDSLRYVNGDFSGAIYNSRKRELILFRDHMGIRPLYYYIDDESVAFSTDLRGLIALPLVKTKVDERWIYETVSGYDAETIDNTPFDKIRCVTPAAYISFSLGDNTIKCEEKAYWELGQHKIRMSSEEEYTKRLRELVSDAVKRRLDAASGIVGAELSGGLDSGVIDVLINREGREGVYFSWSMDPSEVEYAKNDERLIINDICK